MGKKRIYGFDTKKTEKKNYLEDPGTGGREYYPPY
jgi:hypothetical protein